MRSRATDRATGRAVVTGGAGGIELDRQQLAAVGGNTVLESAGASKAADRYTIDINGGASRIVVREADAS